MCWLIDMGDAAPIALILQVRKLIIKNKNLLYKLRH